VSVINNVYIRTELKAKELLDLYIECLPREAKSEVTYDSYGIGARLNTLHLFCAELEETDSLAMNLFSDLGLTASIKLASEDIDYENANGDIHLFQGVLELIYRTKWNLALEYFGRIALVHQSNSLIVNIEDEALLKEALNNTQLTYDVSNSLPSGY
jgi:hypothetical protein